MRDFLKEVPTRCKYSFAVASSRVWGRRVKQFGKNEDDVLEYEDIKREDVQKGKFYQLMPDGLDDGFFNWYCYEREDYQFFKSKEMCVAYFLKFWIIWNSLGKPKPF